MDKLSNRLLEVFKLDAIIVVIIGTCGQLFLGSYSIPAIIGTSVALINFAGNTIISRFLFKRANGMSIMLYVLSYLLRLSLAASIGFLLYNHTISSVLAYVVGYALHFASLIIISTKTLVIDEGE